MQFIFIVLIRFSHKFMNIEKAKIASRKVDTVPALVVGNNELGRKLIHHLENNTVFRAIAVAGKNSGRMVDGIPIISIDAAEKYKSQKNIKSVFIADKELRKEQREQIKKAAKDIEINGFTGYMSNQTGFISYFVSLMKRTENEPILCDFLWSLHKEIRGYSAVAM